ncbi:MAG: biotin carboxylase N-terminal domain-containing protein [Myxococcota bacterium]
MILLIANRGEIACRIIRSARDAGWETVAVYSDADQDAPHVLLADAAVHIGPSSAAQSYLNVERILDAAARTGATHLHPGYGFLSENADFAAACARAGVTFVGPPPDAIAAMADKSAARRRMMAADVPVVPGFDGPAELAGYVDAAAQIGAPLLVKAVAGGGGRGMRKVTDLADLPAAIAAAQQEAAAAFGEGAVLLEKMVSHARHVEVQIIADQQGTVLHLGERDCSAQRRHQKIIEEAPSPAVDAALRGRMGAAAVAAARAVGYVGAGTVEFLLDDDGGFYFLEMNTRLQVEHPVTEAVTGLDLVALQLQIALGDPLPFVQDDVVLSGHAIEARLYAEDPEQDFRPQTGTIHALQFAGRAGCRTDHGVAAGGEVSPWYDPMVAKLIAHGPDRETASRRLIRLIEETVLLGVTTNQRFLGKLLESDDFQAGEIRTDALPIIAPGVLTAEDKATAALLWLALCAPGALDGFQVAHRVPRTLRLQMNGAVEAQSVKVLANHRIRVGETVLWLRPGTGLKRRVRIDGVEQTVQAVAAGKHLWARIGGNAVQVSPEALREMKGTTSSSGSIRAPSAGKVLEVPVTVGAMVRQGDPLVILEAMKIETILRAPFDGQVDAVFTEGGAQVSSGALVVELSERKEEG